VKTETQHRQDILEVGRRLWQRGYVAANDGNISIRVAENEILTTPTEVSKGFMSADELVKVDLDGHVLDGSRKPSSELPLHLVVYRERVDVCAVVHAHPPVATGFAAARVSLDDPLVTEVVLALGGIPLTEYATPGTEGVPDRVRPYLQDYDVFLLANHGVLAVGPDVYAAYFRLESGEHFARINFVARQLGGGRVLPPDQVAELMAIRSRSELVRRRHESCLACGACDAGWPAATTAVGGDVPPARPARPEPTDGDEAELRRTIERIARRVLASLS
jgi:L-fuculose-phosphate aldolase